MAITQIYLHGIISFLLVWQCPIENCSAVSLRQLGRGSKMKSKSFENKFQTKKHVKTNYFSCSDENPTYSINQCTENIIESDKQPRDHRLDRNEFLSFVTLQTQGLISPTSFSKLPVNLVMEFNEIACECTVLDDVSTNCCVGDNAHIAFTMDANSICTRLEGAVGHSCRILRERTYI